MTPNAKVALQHNLGLGGAVVVTMYRKPAEWAGIPPKRKGPSGAMGFGEKMQARLGAGPIRSKGEAGCGLPQRGRGCRAAQRPAPTHQLVCGSAAEVRLRAQQLSLEADERRLRESHRDFHSQTGRAGDPA
eukprot:gene14292-3061_t